MRLWKIHHAVVASSEMAKSGSIWGDKVPTDAAAAAAATVAPGVAVAALVHFQFARPPLSCLVRLDAAASKRTEKNIIERGKSGKSGGKL